MSDPRPSPYLGAARDAHLRRDRRRPQGLPGGRTRATGVLAVLDESGACVAAALADLLGVNRRRWWPDRRLSTTARGAAESRGPPSYALELTQGATRAFARMTRTS